MALSLGSTLPASRMVQLGTEAQVDRSLVLPLCTVDEAGFPHVALLGAWEVVIVDAAHVRLAIGTESRSAANLRRTGRATLLIVDRVAAHYVKLRVRESRAAMMVAPWNAAFEGGVVDVLEDAAHPEHEAGARLLDGIRSATDPAGEPARAAVLAELRQP